MAVEDKFVNANMEAGTRTSSVEQGFGDITTLITTVAVSAGDDNGSVYRLATVPAGFIPVEITLAHSAITGGTDYDVGLYGANRGAAVDIDVLAAALDVSSAGSKDGLATSHATLTNYGKTLAELSGESDPAEAYDLAITANTVGTADGTIAVTAKFTRKS